MRLKVEDHKDLERDMKTGAVINTDSLAFMQNKQKRMAAREQADRISNLEKNVDRLNTLIETLLSKLD